MERFFAGKSVSFEEAFPEIEEIKIEATEGSLGSGFSERKIVLSSENLSEIEPCSNRTCEKGGYDLGDFISTIVYKKDTSKSGVISCSGYEKMGVKDKRKCLNGLSVKVEIRYK